MVLASLEIQGALRENADMDVLVTPAPYTPNRWDLKDRLGRRIGEIYQPSPDKGLMLRLLARGESGDKELGPYPSLDPAMNAVEFQLRGTCQLVGA
jgi:hypothetical protein